jgi:hypothetical protein
MRPEAADYLGKARQCLDEAKQIAAHLSLHHIVAREAYFAAYPTCGCEFGVGTASRFIDCIAELLNEPPL